MIISKKMWCIYVTHTHTHTHTHNGILLSPKKERNFAIGNNVASPREYASVKEVRQGKKIPFDLMATHSSTPA